MPRLKVLTFPDPRLRKVAVPVTKFDKSLEIIASNMLETMYDAKGIGLAAIQVNIIKRIIVIDVSKERNSPLILINPEITKKNENLKTCNLKTKISKLEQFWDFNVFDRTEMRFQQFKILKVQEVWHTYFPHVSNK